MILAFSDGATEVRSPAGSNSLPRPFGTCGKTMRGLPQPLVLQDFSRALLDGVIYTAARQATWKTT